jgi:hypothetical protein
MSPGCTSVQKQTRALPHFLPSDKQASLLEACLARGTDLKQTFCDLYFWMLMHTQRPSKQPVFSDSHTSRNNFTAFNSLCGNSYRYVKAVKVQFKSLPVPN